MTLVGIICVRLSSHDRLATIREIVIDCSDADAMDTFWAAIPLNPLSAYTDEPARSPSTTAA
jgi:hypothetical protein